MWELVTKNSVLFTALPGVFSIKELRGVHVDDGHPEAGVLPGLVPHANLLQFLPDLVHLKKIKIGFLDIVDWFLKTFQVVIY